MGSFDLQDPEGSFGGRTCVESIDYGILVYLNVPKVAPMQDDCSGLRLQIPLLYVYSTLNIIYLTLLLFILLVFTLLVLSLYNSKSHFDNFVKLHD